MSEDAALIVSQMQRAAAGVAWSKLRKDAALRDYSFAAMQRMCANPVHIKIAIYGGSQDWFIEDMAKLSTMREDAVDLIDDPNTTALHRAELEAAVGELDDLMRRRRSAEDEGCGRPSAPYLQSEFL